MKRLVKVFARARDDERGVVFLIAMFAVALVFLLGSAMLGATTGDLAIAHNAARGEAALDVAEAGLEWARHYEAIYPDFNGTLGPTTVGEGSFTVTITSDGRNATAISTGTVGTARRAIKATIRVGQGADIDNKALVVNAQLTSWSKLFIYGDVYVDGDVVTDKDLNILDVAPVGPVNGQGDLFLGIGHSIIDPGNKLSVGGGIFLNQAIVLPPLPSLDYYRRYATSTLAGPQTFQDVLDFSLPQNRLILVEGDVHLGGASAFRAKGKGTIVATGDIWIDNKSYYYSGNSSDKLNVIGLGVTSRLVFNTASQFVGVYRVQGDVDCSRSQPSSVEGAIIANTYTMGSTNDSFKIYLDPYAASMPTSGTPGNSAKIVTWQEIAP
ncbi:MAG: hypothetical protein ACYC6V_09860 [Bacillota bacterium]